jgi:insulysin
MESIIKSPIDKRDYKYIRLPNNLEVLLVQDLETNLSSASLTVGIGSNDEPIPGLAHFLEHMLFMGSKKYPSENYYSKFISENGGSYNAYTSDDHTCYYFSVQNNAFLQALDVLAQFFISPLFNKDAIDREINAVDSEHNKNIDNDLWRQIFILSITADPTTPLSKFTTGNIESLKIPNIREDMIDFYNKYYSSHLSKLVIITPNKIQELENNIIKIFSEIRNTKINPPRIYNLPLKTPSMIHMVPIKSEHTLLINFQVPYVSNIDLWNPYCVILYLLEHQGKNTLVDYLNSYGFIRDVSTIIVNKVGNHLILCIKVTLLQITDYIPVLELIYQYINRIILDIRKDRSIFDKIYEDFSKINKIDFNNIQISDLTDYSINICSNWCKYNLDYKNILCFGKMYEKYSDEKLNFLLSLLEKINPNNSTIVVSSPSFASTCIQVEKWYKIKYNIINNFSLVNNKYPVINQFSLPLKNNYIPNNLVLINKESSKYPVNITNNNKVKIYHKFDSSFSVPKTCIFINMRIPDILKNSIIYTSFKLYLLCLQHQMNAILFEMHMASYLVNISIHHDTIHLYVYGYTCNIVEVLDYIINNIMTTSINYNTFVINKYILKNDLNNIKYELPFVLIHDAYIKKLYNIYYDHNDMLNSLQYIEYKHMINMNKFFNKNTKLKVYIHGNIETDKINKINILVKKLYSVNPCSYNSDLIFNKNINMRKLSDSPSEKNNAICFYYKIGSCVPTRQNFDWCYNQLIIDLINMTVREAFYDKLRTKEQLGYVVKGIIKRFGTEDNKNIYYCFKIQSNHKNNDYLENRINDFIKNFDLSKELDDEIFINNKMALENILLDPDKTMLQNASRYFDSIISPEEIYDIEKILVEKLKDITKKDVLSFYENKIKNAKPDIIKLDSPLI